MADPAATLVIRHDAYPVRAIVRVRVPMSASGRVAEALRLPPALQAVADEDAIRLWLSPDQWLIVSDRMTARKLLSICARALSAELHLAVDCSAALHCAAFEGAGARRLLAMASGVDWSMDTVPAGRCVRTRFARIAAVVHATAQQAFDVYFDRSHRDYMERWLAHALEDPLLRVDACRST